MKGLLIFLSGIAVAGVSASSNAAIIANLHYDSLQAVVDDPDWTGIGAGAAVGGVITNDYQLVNRQYDLLGKDFFIETKMSSFIPGTPGEAGARLSARIPVDDISNPFLNREFELRFMKELDDNNNFIGLYLPDDTLLMDVDGNEAKINVRWDTSNPRLRYRLGKQGDHVFMDLRDSGNGSLIERVLLNFDHQLDWPFPVNRSAIGFGNYAFQSADSQWETIHVQISSPAAAVPVPAAFWLLGSGLLGLAIHSRRLPIPTRL